MSGHQGKLVPSSDQDRYRSVYKGELVPRLTELIKSGIGVGTKVSWYPISLNKLRVV